MENTYTIHKLTVQAFRQALVSHLLSIKREQDIPKITSKFCNMDLYPGERMPLDVFDKEFDSTVSFFQDEYIGLKIANFIDVKFLSLYRGLEIFAAPFSKKNIEVPVVIICHLISRYFRLITDSLDIKFLKIEGCLALEFKSIYSNEICKHRIDIIVLAVHKIIEFFTKKYPDKIIISSRTSTYDLDFYRRYFHAPAELTSENVYLCYELKCNLKDWDDLKKSHDFKSFLSNGFFINPLHHMFHEQFPQYSYTEECQHILITTMGMICPTREQVAQVLNMSVSSLQRRLREEHTTFQEVLLNTRKDLAHSYLVEHELSATYVASLLGYQSSSQFFTAFKSWFAMTPKSYKKMYS